MSDWFPTDLAPTAGELVELQFSDPLGTHDDPGPFFMHDDGLWYRVSPPSLIMATVKAWRPIAAEQTS